MENRKLISIIVPIYNIEQYLKQCLDSILSQTMTNLEIILVDDGSTDHSGEICDQYALKDSRIRVIHKANGGLVSARKAGLELSTGEYVGYVDGDDWIEPDMYERLYEGIESDVVDFSMCSFYHDYEKSRVWIKNGISEGKYTKREIEKRIFPIIYCNDYLDSNPSFGTIWNKLFKRDIIIYSQYKVIEDINILEDVLCTYIAFMLVDSISILDLPLYHYRQRTSSMVRKMEHKQDEIKLYKSIYLILLQEYKCNNINNRALLNQFRQGMLNSLIIHAMEFLPELRIHDELFPYMEVKRGTKIVLYGAGTYGQHLQHYITTTKFCNIVIWTDSRYADYDEEGLPVESPEKIADKEFDCVVIAILSIKAYKAIYNDLIRMNIPPQKICWVDRELIESDETWKMFGMPD